MCFAPKRTHEAQNKSILHHKITLCTSMYTVPYCGQLRHKEMVLEVQKSKRAERGLLKRVKMWKIIINTLFTGSKTEVRCVTRGGICFMVTVVEISKTTSQTLVLDSSKGCNLALVVNLWVLVTVQSVCFFRRRLHCRFAYQPSAHQAGAYSGFCSMK